MVTKSACASLAMATVLLGSCSHERLFKDVGPPWSEVRLFESSRPIHLEAKLMSTAHISDVFPLEVFSGLMPSLSSDEVRLKLGKPNVVRTEDGMTVYVYPRDKCDIEVAEWLLSPESFGGTPSARPYLTSKVRAKCHAPLKSEPLSRLLTYARRDHPALNDVTILSTDDNDPIVDLRFDGDGVVAATIR
jgi:hypothetical protein